MFTDQQRGGVQKGSKKAAVGQAASGQAGAKRRRGSKGGEASREQPEAEAVEEEDEEEEESLQQLSVGCSRMLEKGGRAGMTAGVARAATAGGSAAVNRVSKSTGKQGLEAVGVWVDGAWPVSMPFGRGLSHGPCLVLPVTGWAEMRGPIPAASQAPVRWVIVAITYT